MKKVLFIEDDENFVEIVTAILSKENFKIFVAKDGEEGLRLTKSEQPDLILLDLILPKMDGFEFLKRLRALDDIPWIPVIVFTSQAGRESAEEAKRLGCQGYLIKSNIDSHILKDKLKEFLNL